jgi:hypothetical protein
MVRFQIAAALSSPANTLFPMVATGRALLAGNPNDRLSLLQIVLTVGIGLFMATTTILALRQRRGRTSQAQDDRGSESSGTLLHPYQDPGWLPALARVHLGAQFMPRRTEPDGLIVMRILFLALLMSSFLILFVLTFIVGRLGIPAPALGLLIAALGIVGIAGAVWASNRELDVSTAFALAESYRTHFLLAFALSEAPLVVSFLVCLVRHQQWPYLVALPFHLIGMALIAPGPRNLNRHQEEISSRGSQLSLGRSLSSFPPGKGKRKS